MKRKVRLLLLLLIIVKLMSGVSTVSQSNGSGVDLSVASNTETILASDSFKSVISTAITAVHAMYHLQFLLATAPMEQM